MPVFEYTARNAATGQIMKGQLDVASKDDVMKHIKQNKMMLVNVREAPKQISFSFKRKGVSTRDIVIFTRQFATMINVGSAAGAVARHPGQADREQGPAPTSPRQVVYDVESGPHPGRRVRASTPRRSPTCT